MSAGRNTPVPRGGSYDDEELEAAPDTRPGEADARFHRLPIEQDMERRTLASPPPDFDLDDPTLEHPIADFGVYADEIDRQASPDAYLDRATLPDGVPDSTDRHDTDPAPPPAEPEGD